MREFIDEAHNHRDDGIGRAQAAAKRELPKRFYKAVGIGSAPGGFAVTLDGKTPRTPGQKPVVVPHQPLAEAMAEEWAAQSEFIDPRTMPTVRLVNSAVEAGEERHEALRAEIVKYAGNDLLLYRADYPRELVAGFWLWEVKDMDEAVAWVKRCPNPMPGPSEIEIRPLYEMSDLQ